MRVTTDTRRQLMEIAERLGVSMGMAVELALAAYKRDKWAENERAKEGRGNG